MVLEAFEPRLGCPSLPVISRIIPNVSRTFRPPCPFRSVVLSFCFTHWMSVLQALWLGFCRCADVMFSSVAMRPHLLTQCLRCRPSVFAHFRSCLYFFILSSSKWEALLLRVRPANKGMNRNKLQAFVETGGFRFPCRLVFPACN